MAESQEGFEQLMREIEAAIILKTRKDWEFRSNGTRFVLSLKPTD